MSIFINKLTGRTQTQPHNTIYKDVTFDLIEFAAPHTQSLHGKYTKTDLKASVDEHAILNSLKNIFNTTPGEKILNPTFGVSLTQWLFEPVSEFAAREIGEAILEGVTNFEPRVQMNNVTVVADPEKSQYIIKLSMTIPTLNITKQYSAVLNSPGFDFISDYE